VETEIVDRRAAGDRLTGYAKELVAVALAATPREAMAIAPGDLPRTAKTYDGV
jgi:hypothetical protein